MTLKPRITIAIPTFGREQVLIDTIESLRAIATYNCEFLLVDQTPDHDASVKQKLQCWERDGHVRIIRQLPSIPRAMNRALIEASADVVLFLDDDIIPHADLIAEHLRAHTQSGVVGVVGQVLQPGEDSAAIEHPPNNYKSKLSHDMRFCFRSTIPGDVTNVMAGNLSVKRDVALSIGGFDENFVGVAYRFETEFARRLSRVGTIRYQPTASIRHLAAGRGGTRSFGKHLTSTRPEHSVGDYYFALREGQKLEALRYCARRLVTSAATRFHLKHPWYIPPKLLGEVRGLRWAILLYRRGPKLIQSRESS